MPWRRVAKRFQLAEEKLEGLNLTTDEEQEIRRILPTNKGYPVMRYVFLFLKKGFGEREILSLLSIHQTTFKNVLNKIRMSPLLSSRINMALEKIDMDNIQEKPIEPEVFDDFLISSLEKKISAILRAITPDKIRISDLTELSRSFAILFDKYRTATGKSNINIMGIQAIIGTPDKNFEKIKQLQEQIKEIDNILNSDIMKNILEEKSDDTGNKSIIEPEINRPKIIKRTIT